MRVLAALLLVLFSASADARSFFAGAGTGAVSTPTPVVQTVAFTPSTAVLTVGATISVTVNFNIAVTVNTGGGTPTCAFNVGGLTGTYASGSGTTAIVFTATVGAGQNTAKLTMGATAITLNGGTMKSAGAVNAVLTAANNYSPVGTLQINTSGPTVTGVAFSGAGISGGTGSVGPGSLVVATVTYSSTVLVASGTPYLSFNNGATGNYVSGSNSNQLVFDYVVAPSQATAKLTVTGFSTNGATVRDIAGNDADNSGAVGSPPGTLVIQGGASCTRHFYMSRAAGASDANTGRSPTYISGTNGPWASYAKFNSGPPGGFVPGDCLSFRGGDTFAGNATPSGTGFQTANWILTGSNVSGTAAANDLQIDSESFDGGSGMAILNSSVGDVAGQISAGQGANYGLGYCAFFVNGVSGITISNITLRNGAGSSNPTPQGMCFEGSGNNVSVTQNDLGGFFFAPADNADCCAAALRMDGGYTNISATYNAIHGLTGVTSQDGVGVLVNGNSNGPIALSANHIYNIGGSPSSGAVGWTGNGIAVQHANNNSGTITITYNKLEYNGGNTTGCGQ